MLNSSENNNQPNQNVTITDTDELSSNFLHVNNNVYEAPKELSEKILLLTSNISSTLNESNPDDLKPPVESKADKSKADESTNIELDLVSDDSVLGEVPDENTLMKNSYKNYATNNSLDVRPVQLGKIETEALVSNISGTEKNYQYNGSHPTPITKQIDAKEHEDFFLSSQRKINIESRYKTSVKNDELAALIPEEMPEGEVSVTSPKQEEVKKESIDSGSNPSENDEFAALVPKEMSEGEVSVTSPKQKEAKEESRDYDGISSKNDKVSEVNEPKHVQFLEPCIREPEKSSENEKLTSFKKLGAVIVATIVLVTWVKSDKLAGYWHQSYDGSETLDNVAQSDIGKVGNAVDSLAKKNKLQENLGSISNSINHEANQVFYDEIMQDDSPGSSQTKSTDTNADDFNGSSKNIKVHKPNTNQIDNDSNKNDGMVANTKSLKIISLKQGEKAFFVGDSLMQGVAPWVMRDLQKYHKIDSINLSKHSTGLTFAKFFDWPATVEKTLNENSDVTAIFVFLGGNDGQSIIDPNTQRHVRFGNTRWDELYSENINQILTLAKKHNVQLLWVTPPAMRSKSLNEKMEHLSYLYLKEVPKQGIVINSNEILQLNTESKKYSDSIIIDGKHIKVRTADGIHFTTKGQKHIAQVILGNIQVDDTQKPK